jgi:thiamine biosynthesis lipoprotein
VTVGPLTTLWRAARKSGRLPSDEELAAARKSVGYQFLTLKQCTQTAQVMRGGMRIDLGGIAKGYAADEALRVLEQQGLSRALVAAGGDIVVGAPPPGRAGWQIAISPLRNDKGDALSPARTVIVSHAGVSTSGEAEQHVDIGGVRYSHIIDPRTGQALTTTSSVTVVAPNGTTADALATAVSVLGAKEGIALLSASRDVEGLVVTVQVDKVLTRSTTGFSRLEQSGERERSVPLSEH